jgi:hypothetical protein
MSIEQARTLLPGTVQCDHFQSGNQANFRRVKMKSFGADGYSTISQTAYHVGAPVKGGGAVAKRPQALEG